MAMKKKAASSGSDRGAKMKADAAQKKSQAKTASNLNAANAQKKGVQSTSVRSQFTGGNRVLPNSYGVSGQYLASGATTRRGIDQAKRADAKKAANAAKVAKGKK